MILEQMDICMYVCTVRMYVLKYGQPSKKKNCSTVQNCVGYGYRVDEVNNRMRLLFLLAVQDRAEQGTVLFI